MTLENEIGLEQNAAQVRVPMLRFNAFEFGQAQATSFKTSLISFSSGKIFPGPQLRCCCYRCRRRRRRRRRLRRRQRLSLRQ